MGEADTTGDGYLNQDEFLEVLKHSKVKNLLQAMELEVRDPEVLFKLLDNGSRQISVRELINGVARLKGNARSIDLVILLHEQAFLEDMLLEIDERLCQFSPKVLPSVKQPSPHPHPLSRV